MGRPLIDITGERFGRLVAIEHPFKSDEWVCRCDCGHTTRVQSLKLRKGTTRSCGCLNRELSAARKRTHGLAGTPEYVIWHHAKMRCTNPKDSRWADYGGRGIRMCDDWMHDFPAFLRNVGPRPSKRHSLDRINADGNYEPGNVRWATQLQQANNMRTNKQIAWRGETMTIAEWARRLDKPASVIYLRLMRYGYSVEEAFTKPVGRWAK